MTIKGLDIERNAGVDIPMSFRSLKKNSTMKSRSNSENKRWIRRKHESDLARKSRILLFLLP